MGKNSHPYGLLPSGEPAPPCAASILEAIQRGMALWKSADPSPGHGQPIEATSIGCGSVVPDQAPGIPNDSAVPGGPPPPPTYTFPPPRTPHVISRGQRTVWSDNRRLDPTQPRKVGVLNATAAVKAKLKALAKEKGLSTLPGTGNLSLATRYIEGGLPTVVSYIELAAADEDPHALTWLHVWNDLKPWERKLVTLDDVCAASGVSPVRLLKVIVGVAYESGCDVANLIAAHAHPKVVERATKFAQSKDGIEDRKLLFQHQGFTPSPKGQTINIGVSTHTQTNVTNADASVPSFLQDVQDLQAPVEHVQKQLIAAQDAEVIESPPPKHPVEALWQEG